jgi:hypothetical protein
MSLARCRAYGALIRDVTLSQTFRSGLTHATPPALLDYAICVLTPHFEATVSQTGKITLLRKHGIEI